MWFHGQTDWHIDMQTEIQTEFLELDRDDLENSSHYLFIVIYIHTLMYMDCNSRLTVLLTNIGQGWK